MTTSIITRIAALAGVAALFPCGMYAHASNHTAQPDAEADQTEAVTERTQAVTVSDGCGVPFTYVTCDGTGDADGEFTYTEYVADGSADDSALQEVLSEEAYAEYMQLSERLAQIDAEAGVTEDMTEEEMDAAYAPYMDEINRLNARMTEIFEEAGFTFEKISEEYPDADTVITVYEFSSETEN